MRENLVAVAAALLTSLSSAQALLPAKPAKAVTLNPRTGEIRPDSGAVRAGSIWASTNTLGFYFDLTPDGVNPVMLLDWADVGPEPVRVVRFQIAYAATGSYSDQQFLFYADENGFDARQRALLRGFNITGLPGECPDTAFCAGWIVTIDLEAAGPNFPFTIEGGDYDLDDGAAPNFPGVGLIDFGYTYGLLSPHNYPYAAYGPLITIDVAPYTPARPGTGSGPGMEDAFDLFSGPQGSWATYAGTFSHGGYDSANPNTVFGQYWLDLFGSTVDDCPNPLPGCAHADIGPAGNGDCVVDLPDLGILLANYAPGIPGKSRAQGDIFPFGGGDGIVNLSDLGQMLNDFGTDCR